MIVWISYTHSFKFALSFEAYNIIRICWWKTSLVLIFSALGMNNIVFILRCVWAKANCFTCLCFTIFIVSITIDCPWIFLLSTWSWIRLFFQWAIHTSTALDVFLIAQIIAVSSWSSLKHWLDILSHLYCIFLIDVVILLFKGLTFLEEVLLFWVINSQR